MSVGNPLADKAGTQCEDYVYAGSSLKVKLVGATGAYPYYYFNDALGSPRLVFNGTSIIPYSVETYKPFGTPYGLIPPGDGKIGYAGELIDSAAGYSPGLYYVGARWMDPELGRWLSMDPQLGRLSAPQTQDRYVYCVNNPLRFVDPTGQGFWSWLKGLFFDDDYRYSPVNTQVETRNGEPTLVNRWVPPWENKGWQVSVGTVLVVGGAEVGLAYLGTDLTTAISSGASWLGSKLSSRSAQAAPKAAESMPRLTPQMTKVPVQTTLDRFGLQWTESPIAPFFGRMDAECSFYENIAKFSSS